MKHPFFAIGLLASAVSAFAAGGQTYQVKSGDTLDKVIRHTMGDSPLRVELLRQAFLQQNPQAFTKSSPRVLMAGSVITIPNHDDLLRQHLKPRDGGGVVSYDDRKNWVRYP
jgi:Tfp pilus assembly protein FimV